MADPRAAEQRLTIDARDAAASFWTSVRQFALATGFSSRAAWEIATAVSELVTNVQKYAGSGTLVMRRITSPDAGLVVVVDDGGPGIADIEAAMADGYSRGRMLSPEEPPSINGLGTGLGTVQRLMHALAVENKLDGGLRVTATRWLSKRPP